MSVDIIADGGSAALTVQSYGRFTLTLTPSGRATCTESGEMFWESFEGKYYFAIAWDAYPGDWETYSNTNRYHLLQEWRLWQRSI